MDCILTIDQGNSTVKTVVFSGGKAVDVRRHDVLRGADLQSLFEKWCPRSVVYCAVGEEDNKLVGLIERDCKVKVFVISHETPLPITVKYDSFTTLGLDRVCAAVGASTIRAGEALLVVDAGTAVTLDVVDAQGAFRGGNISPGLNMRFRALHEFTTTLPEVDAKGEMPPFGTDTHTAIRSGVVGGLVAEIERSAAEAAKLYDIKSVVLTGGDAATLASLINNKDNKVVVDDALTAIGMNRIFQYNEDIQ